MKKEKTILKVDNLSISFDRYDSGFNKKDLRVIKDLNLEINQGEIVAVVGSSGSGKSLLAHSILGILPDNASVFGSIEYMGKPLTKKNQSKIRGKEIALIPQSVDFLDPLMIVGKQVKGLTSTDEKSEKILKQFGLKKEVAKLYPYQLSGGMARRVLISTAVIEERKLIIADEPTPGLDVPTAMKTLNTFRKLADDGCGILLITHDIDLALSIADKIAVFYAGTTLEIASVEDFKKENNTLRHPYSKALVEALPQNKFNGIKGFQPYADSINAGCVFKDRCNIKKEECFKDNIEMKQVREGQVRCIHAT